MGGLYKSSFEDRVVEYDLQVQQERENSDKKRKELFQAKQ